MTLEEAREHVGDKVVYYPHGLVKPEDGVITSVNDRYVFVRYGADHGSKATQAHTLKLLSEWSTP